jgi:OOP family OmpA-OmpF porin
VVDQLKSEGRARLYGILFDTDSDHLKDESKPGASVKAYLVTAGVDASRLTTQGFRATNPVASNDTELGRLQNRRVEVVKN